MAVETSSMRSGTFWEGQVAFCTKGERRPSKDPIDVNDPNSYSGEGGEAFVGPFGRTLKPVGE
jgi:hypothetical protein